MKLILFRHGTAIDREIAILQGMGDAQRPLTDKGRDRTEKMAKAIREWDEKIEFVVASPLVRAQQSAEILVRTLKLKDALSCAELVPSAPPQAFAQWLKSQTKNATCVLAVGHEPQLSVFASWALSGAQESFMDLKKSGMICLEFESFDQITAKSAELSWMIQPKLLV